MFGWFRSKSPLSDPWRDWIDWRLAWLRGEFGDDSLHHPVITPSDKFFPGPYSATRSDVETLFDRVCGCMAVERSRIKLRFYNRKGDGQIVQYGAQAAGLFNRDESGKIEIWLEESDLTDAEHVVATSAHELAHVHLLADGHCDTGEPDHEYLTDLLVIYSGLGIFLANSMRRDTTWYQGGYAWSSVRYGGYLDMPQAAYALAVTAYFRGETSPAWVKFLRADVRADFKEELGHLSKGTRAMWMGSGDDRPPGLSELRFKSKSNPEETEPANNTDASTQPDEAKEKETNWSPDGDQQSSNDEDFDDESTGANKETGVFTEADEHFIEGTMFNKDGNYSDAITALTRAWELDPSDSEPLVERAQSYLGLRRYQEAVGDATRRLHDVPDDANALRYRAQAYLAMRQFGQALNDLSQIHKFDLAPSDRMLRGVSHFGNGDHRSALKELTLSICADPYRAISYLARSKVHAANGESEQAQLDLDEAIRRNPDFEDKTFREAALAVFFRS